MKRKLIKKELVALSKVLDVDPDMVLKLRKLLNVYDVRTLLIKSECKKLESQRKLKKKEIFEMLATKHQLSRGSIETMVYGRVKNKPEQCLKCGADVSKYKFIHCDGLCDQCYKLTENEDS